MNFIFRTDASNDMGSGHVMRCLTIADALRKEGVNCSFICRAHEGSFLELIREHDFEVYALPLPLSIKGQSAKQSLESKFDIAHANWLGVEWQKDAEETRDIIGDKKVDCLIVDHYSIDMKWERAMRSSCDHLMVIDDLANRPHDCDLLLDQNFDEEYRYSDLVPSDCLLLIGPRYALLRNEFQIARLQTKSNTVNRILVFFGGTDIDDITGETLRALCKTDLSKIWVDIVVGANYCNIDLLDKLSAQRGRTHIFKSLPHLADLMAEADLAIGAVGVTNWERMCVGLPSIVISVADNQNPISKKLHNLGAVNWLGSASDVNDEIIYKAIKEEISDKKFINRREIASNLCDGKGLDRVLAKMIELVETP
jgi:UDP-2,4-diacetamido-2,4,6-trideoxy-beta-L-altropyranose hydrolase